MAQVLFYLSVVSVVGMLIAPLASQTRGHAVWSWFINFWAAGGFIYTLNAKYPSWEEPDWHSGVVWPLIGWTLFIIGFVVAIRKPRKRNTTVA